jgi:hypothetical protein
MAKHPEKISGFKLGLTFRIHQNRVQDSVYKKPSYTKDVVYVALLAGSHEHLKKSEIIKVGQTSGTLMDRWKRTLSIFNPAKKSLRDNEKEDRRKWLKQANGKEVHVWVKKAGKIKINYKGLPKQFHQKFYSKRWAEEELLHDYYGLKPNQRTMNKDID